ncbi:hypothetical protein A359_04300 [secondary endosymbiont of Ctenarytaina eucalypti]|uniref:Uncharacterized protein n=1 Tax=secondary endosymbiont of Ctenarytaina eucalypti TaxID=1199245 RepID=J3YRT7_9ENTR|nr:hypothetical protein A359_04300 [secondary endosymbiont of Ctenarytaina eucalypti]
MPLSSNVACLGISVISAKACRFLLQKTFTSDGGLSFLKGVESYLPFLYVSRRKISQMLSELIDMKIFIKRFLQTFWMLLKIKRGRIKNLLLSDD